MENANLSPLTEVITQLLAPDGCPWDRAQDHVSMRKHMIEEAYEVCDAIDRDDALNLQEELGDVLYQVVFHAALAEAEGKFVLQDVVDGVAEKMKRRHPHIFSTANGTVAGDWESIKRQEKAAQHQPTALPECLPVTLKLSKLTAKLTKAGVDPKNLAALCDDETERALLTLVLEAASYNREVEFAGQSLAKKLENMLENVNK